MKITARTTLTPLKGHSFPYEICFRIDRNGKIEFISEEGTCRVRAFMLLDLIAKVLENELKDTIYNASIFRVYKVIKYDVNNKQRIYYAFSPKKEYCIDETVEGSWIADVPEIIELASFWHYLKNVSINKTGVALNSGTISTYPSLSEFSEWKYSISE